MIGQRERIIILKMEGGVKNGDSKNLFNHFPMTLIGDGSINTVILRWLCVLCGIKWIIRGHFSLSIPLP